MPGTCWATHLVEPAGTSKAAAIYAVAWTVRPPPGDAKGTTRKESQGSSCNQCRSCCAQQKAAPRGNNLARGLLGRVNDASEHSSPSRKRVVRLANPLDP